MVLVVNSARSNHLEIPYFSNSSFLSANLASADFSGTSNLGAFKELCSMVLPHNLGSFFGSGEIHLNPKYLVPSIDLTTCSNCSPSEAAMAPRQFSNNL